MVDEIQAYGKNLYSVRKVNVEVAGISREISVFHFIVDNMDICDGHVSAHVDYIDRNDHMLIAYFILLGLMTCGHGGLTRIIWPFTRARSLSEPIDTSKRFCCMLIDFVTDELCSFNSCTAIFQFQCTSGVSIVAISRCCSCVSARNSTNDSK